MKRQQVTTSHKWLNLPDRTIAVYNTYDCLAAARAKFAIQARLRRNGQLDYFGREVWPLVPAVLSMQRAGLPYDSTRKGIYRKRLRKELRETDAELRRLYTETANYKREANLKRLVEHLVANPPEGKAGNKYRQRAKKGITLTKAEQTKLSRLPENWNPNSNDQVARWLFEDLGLRRSTSTAGGKPSVDMDALLRIYRNLRKKDEHARPALHGLMHRARLQKIDQDYLDPEVRHDDNGRRDAGIRPSQRDTESGKGNITRRGQGDSESNGKPSVGVGQQDKRGGGRVYPTVKGPEVKYDYADKGTIARSHDRTCGKLGRDPNDSSPKVLGSGDSQLPENGQMENDGRRGIGGGGDPGDNRRVGRVYPTIKMTGTESGRFSYADPPVQSWPPEIRHLVYPGPGFDWLGADYSQIESRVFSILTEDKRDLEIYTRYDQDPTPEWDIHTITGAELFGWSTAELLSKPTDQYKGVRAYAKGFRYGVLLYGGTPTHTKVKPTCICPRCAEHTAPMADVSPSDRKRHAERWFRQHQCAIRWRDNISNQVRFHHRLIGPLGQVWYFMAPWSREVQREAWNRIIQGTASGIIHRATRELHMLQCPLRLQHHDALYSETPNSDTERWAYTKQRVMEKPVPELDGHRFPVSIEVGPSWGEMEHWTPKPKTTNSS